MPAETKRAVKAHLIATFTFKPGNLVGYFRNPLPKLCFRAVLYFTVTETIACSMQLKLGFELLALRAQIFEMAVSHREPRFPIK